MEVILMEVFLYLPTWLAVLMYYCVHTYSSISYWQQIDEQQH